MNEVKRAYLGYSGPEALDVPKEIVPKFLYYLKKNPIKVVFPIILGLITVVLLIRGIM